MKYLLFITLLFIPIIATAEDSYSFEKQVIRADNQAKQDSFLTYIHGHKIRIWTPKASKKSAYTAFPNQKIETLEEEFSSINQSRYVYIYGKRGRVTNGGTIIFQNGMNVSLKEAIESAIYTSALYNDKDVVLIYRGFSNLALDIVEYELNSKGSYTLPCLLYATKVREITKKNPNAYILSVHHSLGVLQGKMGLTLLSKFEKKKVCFCAVAPPTFLTKENCFRLVHLVSEKDPLADAIPNKKEYDTAKKEGTLKIIHPDKKAPLFDHSYQSPSYKEELLNFWKKYLSIQKSVQG